MVHSLRIIPCRDDNLITKVLLTTAYSINEI